MFLSMTCNQTLTRLTDFYESIFGCKTYKISLDAGCTCPNRDGTKGTGGCIFCSQSGSGDFASDRNLSIREQVEQGIKLVEPKLHGRTGGRHGNTLPTSRTFPRPMEMPTPFWTNTANPFCAMMWKDLPLPPAPTALMPTY